MISDNLNLSGEPNVLVSTLLNEPAVVSVLPNFIERLPLRLNQIEKAIINNDLSAVAELTHSLRGTAGNFGFPTIMDVCSKLETQARSQTQIDISDMKLLNDLIGSCQRGIMLSGRN